MATSDSKNELAPTSQQEPGQSESPQIADADLQAPRGMEAIASEYPELARGWIRHGYDSRKAIIVGLQKYNMTPHYAENLVSGFINHGKGIINRKTTQPTCFGDALAEMGGLPPKQVFAKQIAAAEEELTRASKPAPAPEADEDQLNGEGSGKPDQSSDTSKENSGPRIIRIMALILFRFLRGNYPLLRAL